MIKEIKINSKLITFNLLTYVIINKPFEVLTQFTDEAGRATLKDYVKIPDIYPVGRLDYDSEGLVLLTDDKDLQHRLADPKFRIEKTYWAQVENMPDESALQKLRSGVYLKNIKTLPAKVTLLQPDPIVWERPKPIRFRQNIPTAWVQISLTQGMNRQVRKMTAAVGFPTLRLIRVSIGPLQIAGLLPGQYRHLTPEEVKILKTVSR